MRTVAFIYRKPTKASHAYNHCLRARWRRLIRDAKLWTIRSDSFGHEPTQDHRPLHYSAPFTHASNSPWVCLQPILSSSHTAVVLSTSLTEPCLVSLSPPPFLPLLLFVSRVVRNRTASHPLLPPLFPLGKGKSPPQIPTSSIHVYPIVLTFWRMGWSNLCLRVALVRAHATGHNRRGATTGASDGSVPEIHGLRRRKLCVQNDSRWSSWVSFNKGVLVRGVDGNFSEEGRKGKGLEARQTG